MSTESTKTIKGRISNKHGTEADWYAAGTAANPFIPLPGELIIYDPSTIGGQPRTKYGDGQTPVHLLPFGNKAIIDVLELPTDGIDKGVFYRLLTAKFMTGRDFAVEKHGVNWHCRCVETLPEVGVVCTDAQMTFVDVYYSIADNAIYGYVDDELAQLFNTSSGWQSIEALCAIADVTWGSIITTKEEDADDGSLYVLLAYEFYTYQDGWTKLIMSQEKQPKFDIQWNGNADGKFVLDMNPLGFEHTYFVKVSDQVFTVDELVGGQFMQTSGYICDINTSNIDSEGYPGALSLDSGVVICYDASTLNAALGLPEEYITNGTYFVYIKDESDYIIYTHRLVGRAGITKIDSKYIDSTDILEDVNDRFDSLHSVARTGDYNSLFNRPIVYTDVVRYGSSQSLSELQRLGARQNIDVYSKSEVLEALPYPTNLSYTINQDNSSYSVTGGSHDSFVVIPALYKGKPVTSIGDSAFNGSTSLTSISIPDSVISIGVGAFRNCTSLISVILPDSITSFGNYAFYGCTSLTSVEIPDSVTTIGDNAFYGCTSLTSIKIPDSVTNIGYSTFSSCTSLTSIVIPDSVTGIQTIAFSNCSSLTDVYYTGTEEQWENITIDGGNENLTNATIHYNFANDFISINEKIDNLATVDKIAEMYTNEEEIVDIYAESRGIGWASTFGIYDENSEPIKSGFLSQQVPIVAGENVTFEVDEENQIVKINTEVDTSSLATVDKITVIDTWYGDMENVTDDWDGISWTNRFCISVEDEDIEGTVFQKIPLVAGENVIFSYDEANNAIAINANGGSIGLEYEVFDDCAIVIGLGICTDLDVVIPETYQGLPVTAISEEAFSGTNIRSLETPGSIEVFGDYVLTGCDNLEKLVINDGPTELGIEMCVDCSNLRIVRLPTTLDSLPFGVFYDCSALEEIDIPEGTTYLDDCVFSGCTSLKRVSFPKSLLQIDNETFYNCSSLKDIVLYATKIGDSCFSGCSNLKNIEFKNTIIYFSDSVFIRCSNLEKVVLTTDENTNMGTDVFLGCLEANIYCTGEGETPRWQDWNPNGRPVVWNFANDFFAVNEKLNNSSGGSTASLIGTWTVIDEPEIPSGYFPLAFTSNGEQFVALNIGYMGSSSWGITTLAYHKNNGESVSVYVNNPSGNYGIAHGWRDEAYKTITVIAEPTDPNAIAWLGNNTDAPKISSSENGLPKHTEEDEGKFLRIVNGAPAWAAIPNAEDYSF